MAKSIWCKKLVTCKCIYTAFFFQFFKKRKRRRLWTKIKGWQVCDKAYWKLNVPAVACVCIQKKAWNWPIDYALFLCSMCGFVTKLLRKMDFLSLFSPLKFYIVIFFILCSDHPQCVFLCFLIIMLHKISVSKLSV